MISAHQLARDVGASLHAWHLLFGTSQCVKVLFWGFFSTHSLDRVTASDTVAALPAAPAAPAASASAPVAAASVEHVAVDGKKDDVLVKDEKFETVDAGAAEKASSSDSDSSSSTDSDGDDDAER